MHNVASQAWRVLLELAVVESARVRDANVVNKNAKERVRSIFINSSNNSLFVVSVKISMQLPTRATSMYCRSVPISDI